MSLSNQHSQHPHSKERNSSAIAQHDLLNYITILEEIEVASEEKQFEALRRLQGVVVGGEA